MKTRTKLIISSLLASLLFSGAFLGATIYFELESTTKQLAHEKELLMNAKKEYLRDIVDVAYNAMASYGDQEGITKEKFNQEVPILFSSARYDVDKSAYFFSYVKDEQDPTKIRIGFHPTRPELNNTLVDMDHLDYNPDESKRVEYRKMLIASVGSKDSFAEYYYIKGKEQDKDYEPKISKARYYKKFDCYLVGGIYLDNVAAEMGKRAEELKAATDEKIMHFAIVAGVLTILFTLLGYLIGSGFASKEEG